MDPKRRSSALEINALEAAEDAERNGYQETILFKVPSFDVALIPLA